MKLLKIKDIFHFEKGTLQSTKCTPGEYDFITASSEWKKHDSYDYDQESLVVAVAASGSLGRVHYVNGKFISSDLCFILTPKDPERYPIDMRFYFTIFRSLKEDLVKQTATGTAKQAINKTNFGNYEIPYYLIDEQQKLASKFDRVAEDKVNLNNEIYTQKKLISQLKQIVLQEAVEGKLTQEWREQNSNTEPASKLLEDIKNEKEQLIKDKKIKNEKKLQLINAEEVPFELPEDWVWCRLGDISEYIQRGKSPSYVEKSNFPVISQKCVQWERFDFHKARFINENTLDKYSKERFLRNGDLLWNSTGDGTVGRLIEFINKTKYKKILADSHVAVIRLLKVHPTYILYYLSTKLVQDNLIVSGSTKQTELSRTTIINHLVPLPPLSEQKVIVEKVEVLIQKLKTLRGKINSNEVSVQVIMQSILQEAFNK